MTKEQRNAWIVIGLAVVSAGVLTFAFRKKVGSAVKTAEEMAQQAVNIVLKPEQEAVISGLHPEVQAQFRSFVNDVEKSGWSVVFTSGTRSFAKQLAEYNADHRNAKPGHSHHNFGLAADMNLVKAGKWLKKASPTQEWIDSGAVALAKKNGLSWGGDKFGSYKDNVHFYKNVPVEPLIAKGLSMFGSIEKIDGTKIPLS